MAARTLHYLILTDNHGGPRHQIAVEKAGRKLYRQHRFAVIAPFTIFYGKMAENDPELLAATGAAPGSVGDITDVHAGTNETSLMLAIAPDRVDSRSENLPRAAIGCDTTVYRLLEMAGRLVSALGLKRLGAELPYLGAMLSWANNPDKPTYIGDPSQASAESGRRMLDAHADEAVRQLERAMQGEPPYSVPML